MKKPLLALAAFVALALNLIAAEAPKMAAAEAAKLVAAGKAVLCEKPLAGSLQDVDAMIRARDIAGKPVAVAYQHTYDPLIVKLKRQLLDGAIDQRAPGLPAFTADRIRRHAPVWMVRAVVVGVDVGTGAREHAGARCRATRSDTADQLAAILRDAERGGNAVVDRLQRDADRWRFRFLRISVRFRAQVAVSEVFGPLQEHAIKGMKKTQDEHVPGMVELGADAGKGGEIIGIFPGCDTSGLLAKKVSQRVAQTVDAPAVDVKAKVEENKQK